MDLFHHPQPPTTVQYRAERKEKRLSYFRIHTTSTMLLRSQLAFKKWQQHPTTGSEGALMRLKKNDGVFDYYITVGLIHYCFYCLRPQQQQMQWPVNTYTQQQQQQQPHDSNHHHDDQSLVQA